jgi:hypothetical protein
MMVTCFPQLNQNHLFIHSFSYNTLIRKSQEKGQKDLKIILQVTELPQWWNFMNMVINFQVAQKYGIS